MKISFQSWIILLLLVVLAICLLDRCDTKIDKRPDIDTNEVKREKIENKKDEVKELHEEAKELKAEKAKIKYKTFWDTIPVYDTLWVNLARCDSVNKIKDTLISILELENSKQDTIIKGQEEIISDLDLENQYLTNEVKKQKKRMFFTKVLAGVAIVITLLISH